MLVHVSIGQFIPTDYHTQLKTSNAADLEVLVTHMPDPEQLSQLVHCNLVTLF